MIQCANCGQVNNDTSNFCRFCGNNFLQQSRPTNETGSNYEYEPPRPYSWKTDEYQIKERNAPKTQQINRVQPLQNDPYRTNQTARSQPQPFAYQQPNQQTLAYQQPNQMYHGYRCPRCATQALPIMTRKISTAGWVTFGVLLAVFLPLFWIGLLIKEDVRVCPVCQMRLNH